MKHLLLLVALLIATPAFSATTEPTPIYTKKPWAVGFAMNGTVTNIAMVDEHIAFKFTGWFLLHQYPWGGTTQQVIKVDCQRGISARVTPTSFVAKTSDLRGGSVQNDKSRLLAILRSAEQRGIPVKISLLEPRLEFAKDGFTLTDAQVWTITDADLK